MTEDAAYEWIFTFGYGHVHPVTKEPLHNRFVRIHGTESGARHQIVRRFGVKWAFQYPSEADAGVERYELKELTPSELPPATVEVESQPGSHTILGVRELRAPYYRRSIEESDPDFMLRYVLVAGSISDYTVYQGIGPAEWVKDFGNKVHFKLAAAMFGGLDERRYRE